METRTHSGLQTYNLIVGLLFGIISLIWVFYTSPKLFTALPELANDPTNNYSILNQIYKIDLVFCAFSIAYWAIATKVGFFQKIGFLLSIITTVMGLAGTILLFQSFILIISVLSQ